MVRLARNVRRLLLACGLAAALAGEALACSDDGSGKPTVALVLSGGGALAASQIGAIRLLEELHVPVHCIVGTSMGAVVGALYASGHNADEVRDLFLNADWGAISTGRRPYRNLGWRGKEDEREFFSEYVVGVGRDGVTLPSGLTSLRGMRGFLREATEQVAHESDFDRLPIPFRATGTDLNTGEAVTLAKGDIVDAALASMAVPALYPGQKVDGRVLIDGGMSKQVPIDIARDMGADIIIVVDTTLEPGIDPDRPPSVVTTVMQIVSLIVWRNYQEQIKQLAPGDVHIQPDMSGQGATSFDRVSEGYEIGYKAAQAHSERLRAIAAEAAPRRTPPAPLPDQIRIATVTVSSASGISENLILRRFGIEPGDVVTREDIREGLGNIAALGAFDTVDYSIEPDPAGSDVDIVTVPRGAGNQRLQLGLNLSTTNDGDAYYGVLGRWTIQPLNRRAGEFRATTEIGTNLMLDLQWTQPLGTTGAFYVESGLNYTERTVPVNVGDVRLAERRDNSASARLIFGREFGRWGVAEIGAQALTLDTDFRVGDTQGLGAQSGDYLGVSGRFAIDTFNSPSFPIRGQFLDFRVDGYGSTDGDAEATLAQLVLASAQTLGPFATFVRFEGGILDQETTALPPFRLGGFKRLSGFEDNSVPATEYGLLRLEGFMRLGADVRQTFGIPILIGATLEAAAVNLDVPGIIFDDEFFAGSIYAAVDTVLGPAYLAYGHGEGGRQSFYLFFGMAF